MRTRRASALIIGAVLMMAGCSSGDSSSSEETPTATAVSTPKSNLNYAEQNEGFKDAGNGLAYRWTTSEGGGCTYGKCGKMQILAYEDCSDVYAKANFLVDNVVVDWGNDSVSHLSSGERADLEFTSTEKYASGAQAKVKLVELNCY